MQEDKQLQEMILTYRILESRLASPENGLLKQRDMLISKLIEVQGTLQSIDEIQKGKGTTLFQLGSETFVMGEVKDKQKMIMEVGANVALEKTSDEAKESLEKRRVEIEANLKTIQSNILDISANMEKLEAEIQQMSGDMQKLPEER
jgi:prefoldin alpha subunit